MELKKGRKKNGNERDREENRERIRETENIKHSVLSS